jgi:hypothetical protein
MHSNYSSLILELYGIVNKLSKYRPDRKFTPDGHLVGSLGEVYAEERYGLHLAPASTKGFDATATIVGQIDKTKVEIKTTQREIVSFRHKQVQHVLVLKLLESGEFCEIYNGPGSKVEKLLEGRTKNSSGQYSIALSKLRLANNTVAPNERLPSNTKS